MINEPNEMTFDSKKFSMILYGSPGVGKTTLALSAPDPVLIDFDRGISRIKAEHRRLAKAVIIFSGRLLLGFLGFPFGLALSTERLHFGI